MPGRVLRVQILYPTISVKAPTVRSLAPPAYRYGPYPVIVFAHGFDVDPNTYRALLVSWVEAGYVVVAPFFPDTSTGRDRGPARCRHRVGRVQPARRRRLCGVNRSSRPVGGRPRRTRCSSSGLVDPARLVLAGQSDGADTVAALLYDRAYAGTLASMPVRPKAVALLSGAEWTARVRRLLGSRRRWPAGARGTEPDGLVQRPGRQLRALQHADGHQVVPRARATPPTSARTSARAPRRGRWSG